MSAVCFRTPLSYRTLKGTAAVRPACGSCAAHTALESSGHLRRRFSDRFVKETCKLLHALDPIRRIHRKSLHEARLFSGGDPGAEKRRSFYFVVERPLQ